MAELSADCIERLKEIEGRLDSLLDFNLADRRPLVIALQDLRSLVLAHLDATQDDDECREILRGLEPQIDIVIHAVMIEAPADVVRRNLADIKRYISAAQQG